MTLYRSLWIFVWLSCVCVKFSEADCQATAVYPALDANYTFAIATLDGEGGDDVAQRSCYYGCGGQILTNSLNAGNMARLTMLDNASSFLLSTGFLKAGNVYRVNHLGLPDNQGGNGIGCLQVQDASTTKSLSLSDPACQSSTAALCGFWGLQIIPKLPFVKPSPTSTSLPSSSSSLPVPNSPSRSSSSFAQQPISTVSSSSTSSRPSFSSEYDPSSPSPSASSTSSQLSTSTSLTTTTDSVTTSSNLGQPTSIPLPVSLIRDDSNVYIAVNAPKNKVTTVEDGVQLCSRMNARFSDVTSSGLSVLLERLEQKQIVAVASWNGDGYGLTDNECLLLSVANSAIAVGLCEEANTLLCQL